MSFNVPAPKLGNVYAFTINTPDFETSLAFYQKLGFSETKRSGPPSPWILLDDGAVLILLRQSDEPFLALTYFTEDVDRIAAELKQQGLTFLSEPKPGEQEPRYSIASPDGTFVSIERATQGFTPPAGPTMLSLPQSEYTNPARYVNKRAGLYGEFAEPVKDIDASVAFWGKLGFAVLFRHPTWGILSDGLAVVGVHQTAEFSRPVITFFAAGRKEMNDQLFREGITNYKDLGNANIVLETPENQRINLFAF